MFAIAVKESRVFFADSSGTEKKTFSISLILAKVKFQADITSATASSDWLRYNFVR